jgi:hypothetical protein
MAAAGDDHVKRAIHRDTTDVCDGALSVRKNASSCASSRFFKPSGLSSLCPFGDFGARL